MRPRVNSSAGEWFIRVAGLRGTDPASGRRRWLTRTVRGTDRTHRELKAFAAYANIAPAVGAHTTVAALLDQWFARGRSTWSPTTVRNLTSIVERHLKPGLGDILVGDLTTAIVDEFYGDLRRQVGSMASLWRLELFAASTLRFTLRWSGATVVLGFENVADHATLPEMSRPRCGHRRTGRLHSYWSSSLATPPSISI